MENSFLNQAHWEGRKADKFTRQGLFERAIECHERAIGHLAQAMNNCNLTSVQQSLSWQRDCHLRQVLLLQSKINIIQKYRQKQSEAARNLSKSNSVRNTNFEKHKQFIMLKNNIFKCLSEAESALFTHTNICEKQDPNLGKVVECHHKLRQLLDELLESEKDSETTELKISSAMLPSSIQDSTTSLSLDKENHEYTEDTDLPALAPLEVPQFDFSTQFDGHQISPS